LRNIILTQLHQQIEKSRTAIDSPRAAIFLCYSNMTTNGASRTSRNGFNLQTCARPNILALQPYRCARDDYKDDGTNVLLDANENAYGPGLAFDQVKDALQESSKTQGANSNNSTPRLQLQGLNRYPDP